MKRGVLILTDVLHSEGAENVMVNIAIRLKESNCYTPIICATRYGGVLEERLKKNGIKCIKLNRKHRLEFYKFYHLKSLIESDNVKLIHSHKMGSNFWGVLLGALWRLPTVSHIHGQVYNWTNFVINYFIGRLSSKLITVSNFEKKGLLTQNISPIKIVTIYNGLDPSRFQIKPNPDLKIKLGLEPSAHVVGISAALRKEKKHETFLLAAREILKQRKDVNFLILGEGIRKSELESLASELGIRNNCIFTGFVKNIPEILSIIDIGVLTSEREGLPLTLLEYMASSKPIVSTNVGGVGEVIKEGVNGFLVAHGDYKKLADRINLLLDNKSLALILGNNGLSILKERFSEDIMISKIVDLYDELVNIKKQNLEKYEENKVS